MKKSDSAEKPITEEINVYPAGRGKALIIIKKSIPPKPKTYKHKNPRFAHARIQTNPEDITITEYLHTTDHQRKYIYLFPAKKQLNHKEREELALSLLATLPQYPIPRYLGKADNNKSSHTSSSRVQTYSPARRSMIRKNGIQKDKFPIFLTTQQRSTLKKKWKRYRKWRKRNS